MTPDEYSEKYKRYMQSKVRKALNHWAAANDRVTKLEAQLAAAQERECALWNAMHEVEAANPDEVALSKEIGEEHSRRLENKTLFCAAA